MLFFATARRKESKEAPPSAHLPLKITHVLLAWTSAAFGIAQASLALLSFARCLSKARKLANCACSNSPRFLTENFPDFLHATDVRTESLTQHRFARWFLLCPRIQNSGPPAPKAGALNELLWITHNSLHHPLIIAQHQLSVKKRFRPHWSSVKEIRDFYR